MRTAECYHKLLVMLFIHILLFLFIIVLPKPLMFCKCLKVLWLVGYRFFLKLFWDKLSGSNCSLVGFLEQAKWRKNFVFKAYGSGAKNSFTVELSSRMGVSVTSMWSLKITIILIRKAENPKDFSSVSAVSVCQYLTRIKNKRPLSVGEKEIMQTKS